MSSIEKNNNTVMCPMCNRNFDPKIIQEHVNKCIFLNEQTTSTNKRSSTDNTDVSPRDKKIKLNNTEKSTKPKPSVNEKSCDKKTGIPLAEQMRPINLDDLLGQKEAFGPGSMIRTLLHDKQIPNMILWGPPGCGKTSLANVIANLCKDNNKSLRFVKLSATMSGISDVKEVVKVAKNEAQFKRKTVLFMDEIHRFNKLQQDTFLPHVESGTIILIGATTENPSFSLNTALLSRCRVIVFKKLSHEDVMAIMEKALSKDNDALVVDEKELSKDYGTSDIVPRWVVSREALEWVSQVCDGDARVALGALELALNSSAAGHERPAKLTLAHVQDGIKRSHVLYDRAGEEHYNTVSALHKCIRAGHDSAALYWCARALSAGDDPRYIARRMVRAAAEDIGLADPSCLVEAVSCAQAVQLIGSPECDVILAQLAVRLARAPKSTEVYHSLLRCRGLMEQGPLPPVPLHLRNAPTTLMKNLGYGRGYNPQSREVSGLTYMPEGMEHINLFDPNTKKK